MIMKSAHLLGFNSKQQKQKRLLHIVKDSFCHMTHNQHSAKHEQRKTFLCQLVEDFYEKLCNQPCTYDSAIRRDVNRTLPQESPIYSTFVLVTASDASSHLHVAGINPTKQDATKGHVNDSHLSNTMLTELREVHVRPFTGGALQGTSRERTAGTLVPFDENASYQNLKLVL